MKKLADISGLSICMLVVSTAAHALGPVGSNRLNFQVDQFHSLFRDKVEHCFVEREKSLDFYLTACDKIDDHSAAHQTFLLSDRVNSWLDQDIAKLKSQLGDRQSPLPDIMQKIEILAPRDTLGRFVIVDYLGTQLPIGWISHDLDLDGRENKPEILDLCNGAWSFVCQFDAKSKTFQVGFKGQHYATEDSEPTTIQGKITKVHYAGIYSRGNDDFVKLHYYDVKGAGTASDQSFPLSTEWKNALASRLGDRVAPHIKQIKTPRAEPNYVTSLHPVFVLEVQDTRKRTSTQLIFGASVIYLKNSPAMASCEDDTGAYQLHDFSLFSKSLSKPYSGRAIEKLALEELLPLDMNAFIHMHYGFSNAEEGFDWSAVPSFEPSIHFDLFNIGSSHEISAQKSEQTYVIMKVDRRGLVEKDGRHNFSARLRSNAVREYLEIAQYENGKWSAKLSAFNPNDYANANVVSADGKFLINPETISEIWNSQNGVVGKSQPYQRALSMALKEIEKRALRNVEDPNRLALISDQHNKFLLEDFQPITAHSKNGLIGHYISAFRSFLGFGFSAIEENPAGRSIVPRAVVVSMYENASDLKLEDVKLIDPLVLEIFMQNRVDQIDATIDQALDRIAAAENPALQIAAEVKRGETVARQVDFVNNFFSYFKQYESDVAHLNQLLARARRLPMHKRPKTYPEVEYPENDNEPPRHIQVPFNTRLLQLLQNKEVLTPRKFYDEVIARERQLIELEKTYRKATPGEKQDTASLKLRQSAIEMYRYMFDERDLCSQNYALESALNQIENPKTDEQ